MMDAAIRTHANCNIHLTEQKNGTLYVTVSAGNDWIGFPLSVNDVEILISFFQHYVKHHLLVDV